KVRGKIFFICGEEDGEVSFSVKLPQSARTVLKESFARPTEYGLGRSGWVSCRFTPKHRIDEKRVARWIDESYRAIAPKRLVKAMDEAPALPAASKRARATSTKPATPKTKIRKRVILLCEDELRAERAERALAARGVRISTTSKISDVRQRVRKKALDAIII